MSKKMTATVVTELGGGAVTVAVGPSTTDGRTERLSFFLTVLAASAEKREITLSNISMDDLKTLYQKMGLILTLAQTE